MKQFKSYPIFINDGTYWTENVLSRQASEFLKKGDRTMVDWLDSTGKRIYEITPNTTGGGVRPGYVNTLRNKAADYEATIERLLNLIEPTQIGKALLSSLDKAKKHWIVPLDADDRHACKMKSTTYGCGAYQFPGKPKEGGGSRVYFSPSDFPKNPDEALFHELVHAYRDGRYGYSGMKWTPMNQYLTAEEFIALHLQNMYREDRGYEKYFATYRALATGKLSSKDDVYQHFAGSAEDLMAFKYFVRKDELARTVSTWTSRRFNPWYDHPVLERMWLSGSGIPQLPLL